MKTHGDDREGGFSGLSHFAPGARVELHPATDRWMRGDRYGEVLEVSRKFVEVRLDVSGRTVRLLPRDIGAIL